MKTVTVEANVTIDLGYQYDNLATEVVFPSEIIDTFTDSFGSTGDFMIWYRRSGDSLGYPIGDPLVVFDSTTNTVTWQVVSADTENPGTAQVQLRYIIDEVCVMSTMYNGFVNDSVDTGEEVPEPMEQWADAIMNATGAAPIISEVADIRTGYDGTVYQTAGEAVRTQIEQAMSSGISEEVKQALLACFEHVAWIDEDGQDYVDALESALYPPANLVNISAVYTQSGTVYDTDSLNSLKADLVVTAKYDDLTTETITNYTLSGALETGTSTITVGYGGKTTTFDVNVTRGLDYTEDALSDVTWNSGYGYSASNGTLTTRSGAYCTNKFEVQDLSYAIANNDANNTTFYLFMWDENDTYLGAKQASTARFQFKQGYKYAVEVRNSGTFDSSTITMLPVDKRTTAVPQFEIDLAANASSVSKQNGYYELNVKALMNAAGVTNSNYTYTINRQSIIGMIGQAVTTGNFPFATDIRIGTFHYGSNMLLSIFVKDIAVSDENLAALQEYLVTNNVKIKYNY